MNKYFLIIVLVSLGLVVALYSLPKIIVGEKQSTIPKGVANRDLPAKKNEQVAENEATSEEVHTNALTESQQKQILQLKKDYLAATSANKQIAGNKLIEAFGAFQKYDSAGFYAEKLSDIIPNEKNWITTADYYYQAFTFAIDEAKGAKLGEKARTFYQKALDKNPNLLLAKTNMAMTYVSTPTPMQGILLLREVVAQSPDFEPALFNLGLLSMRSNQFAKAVERFKHIIQNNPKNTKAAFYLGVSLVRLGRNDEAKEVLLKVKSMDKDAAVQAEVSEILNELK